MICPSHHSYIHAYTHRGLLGVGGWCHSGRWSDGTVSLYKFRPGLDISHSEWQKTLETVVEGTSSMANHSSKSSSWISGFILCVKTSWPGTVWSFHRSNNRAAEFNFVGSRQVWLLTWISEVMRTTWLTAPGRSIGSAWLCVEVSLSPLLCRALNLCPPNTSWNWFYTSVSTV